MLLLKNSIEDLVREVEAVDTNRRPSIHKAIPTGEPHTMITTTTIHVMQSITGNKLKVLFLLHSFKYKYSLLFMTNKYLDQVYDFWFTASRGRRTPAKFAIPHLRVTLGPGGQIVKLLPNNPADGQPARVEIQDVDESVKCDPQTEELKCFPGPLVKLVLTL